MYFFSKKLNCFSCTFELSLLFRRAYKIFIKFENGKCPRAVCTAKSAN